MQRKKIEVTVTDASSDDRKSFAPRDALGFLDWFRREIDKVPTEFIGTAIVDLDVCESYEGHAVRAMISYTRDETEEELSERAKRASEIEINRKMMEYRSVAISEGIEHMERMMLAELKKKYES